MRNAEEAFVIRLRPPVAPSPEGIDGRIEHVPSGREARFGSFGEMLTFIRSVLNDLPRVPEE